jgi:peptide/nickel transport system substrate-binding protein
MLRLAGGVAGLAMVNAALAACGDDDDDDDTAPTATTGGTTASPTSGAAAPTATTGGTAASPTTSGGTAQPTGNVGKLVNEGMAPEGAGMSGELTIGLSFDPTSLDPAATYTLNNGRWQKNVFSGLTWRDENLVLYDGEEGRPSPSEGFGLAESWEYLDDATLQFKLKSGITFHNGEAFTAQTVKDHFDRLLAEETASPQAFNYVAISSVEVVDDTTVKIIFGEVDPVMITKLSGYGGFITPSEASKDTAFGSQQSPGTGPYQVVEYVKDDHLTLEAWEDYWGPRKPHIQRLTYRIIPDDNTRLSEFLAGGIDVLTLNVSQADAAQGNPDLQVVDIGVPTVSGLRLNASMAPTDNKQVRQAIAHAIDLQTIIDTILGGYARAVPIWQSPFSFGYDENLAPYEYDPEMSKQLLTESGLPTPVKLTYDLIGSDTQGKEIANAVKDMLDEVGFEVELREHESATYYDDYVAGKHGNIAIFGWGGWTLDFDNTYFSMHHSEQTYNPHYKNPEVDTLLDEQRGTLDQAKRLDIAKQVNQILYDDAIDVALYQNVYLWGVSKKVRNFLIPPDERLFWLDAWVEG